MTSYDVLVIVSLVVLVFGFLIMLPCIMLQNIGFYSNWFCNELNNKDHVCNHKPFPQSYLVVHFRFCYCLWTINILIKGYALKECINHLWQLINILVSFFSFVSQCINVKNLIKYSRYWICKNTKKHWYVNKYFWKRQLPKLQTKWWYFMIKHWSIGMAPLASSFTMWLLSCYLSLYALYTYIYI